MNAQGDDVTASVEFFGTDGRGSANLVRYLHATLAAARAFVACAQSDAAQATSARETRQPAGIAPGEGYLSRADETLH